MKDVIVKYGHWRINWRYHRDVRWCICVRGNSTWGTYSNQRRQHDRMDNRTNRTMADCRDYSAGRIVYGFPSGQVLIRTYADFIRHTLFPVWL